MRSKTQAFQYHVTCTEVCYFATTMSVKYSIKSHGSFWGCSVAHRGNVGVLLLAHKRVNPNCSIQRTRDNTDHIDSPALHGRRTIREVLTLSTIFLLHDTVSIFIATFLKQKRFTSLQHVKHIAILVSRVQDTQPHVRLKSTYLFCFR